MLHELLTPSRAETPRLEPSRALLSPLFVVSLVVLALNDHVLKGAGLLPGWLTGKLSDFAGLVVAPVVLAVLLRTRTTPGFALCQAAAVAFLAALKLSPVFDAAWSAAMNGVGIGWENTRDPSDLIACLIIIPSGKTLVAHMARPAALWRDGARRVGQALLWPTAAFFLMATSQPPCENYEETTEELDLATAPLYGDGLSGQEILDLATAPRELSFVYSSVEENDGCEPIASQPPTTLTLTIDTANAVATHTSVHIDESVATPGDCQTLDEHTSVVVATTATFTTADGLVVASAPVELTETYDGEVSGSLWSDDPATAAELTASLGLAPRQVSSFGAYLVFEASSAWGSFSVSLVEEGMSESEDYEHCEVGRWTSAEEP